MAVFESLSPAERARQLANPEGAVGLAVAEWLNETNKQGNARSIAQLGIEAGNHVLEIGFGNGRTVPEVIAQAADVRYSGVDISPTMVAEARAYNATLVAAGRASFHLASAEKLPFAVGSFERAFSIGVIHFWAEPAAPLAELRRVMCPGGLMLMGCLAPKGAPDFARPEFGFYLREAASWDALCCAAGFADVHVETIEFQQVGPGGAPIWHYGIILRGRA